MYEKNEWNQHSAPPFKLQISPNNPYLFRKYRLARITDQTYGIFSIPSKGQLSRKLSKKRSSRRCRCMVNWYDEIKTSNFEICCESSDVYCFSKMANAGRFLGCAAALIRAFSQGGEIGRQVGKVCSSWWLVVIAKKLNYSVSFVWGAGCSVSSGNYPKKISIRYIEIYLGISN